MAAAISPDMRTSVVALILASSSLAVAQPQVKEKWLEPQEIAASVHPLRADIERCYLDNAGEVKSTGKLEITIVIARDGFVLSSSTATPGVPAKAAKAIDACVQPLIKAVMFPVRRNDTTGVVPFIFQRTESPGSGPQLSCWDPKGCHTTEAKATPAKPLITKRDAARRAPRR
jgi:hypothetical protein